MNDSKSAETSVRRQFEKWWGYVTRQGDPERRTNLSQESFEAGWHAHSMAPDGGWPEERGPRENVAGSSKDVLAQFVRLPPEERERIGQEIAEKVWADRERFMAGTVQKPRNYINEFDEWIEVTGALEPESGWHAECSSIICDAQTEIERLRRDVKLLEIVGLEKEARIAELKCTTDETPQQSSKQRASLAHRLWVAFNDPNFAPDDLEPMIEEVSRLERDDEVHWKTRRALLRDIEALRPAHETTEECKDCLKLIDERDRAEDWADDLAGDIAQLLGEEIGEHSSGNCPWGNAHDAAGYELDKRKRAAEKAAVRHKPNCKAWYSDMQLDKPYPCDCGAEKTSPVLDHRFQPDPIDDGICGTCGSTRLSHRGESPRTPAND